jgi:hypothetical protein
VDVGIHFEGDATCKMTAEEKMLRSLLPKVVKSLKSFSLTGNQETHGVMDLQTGEEIVSSFTRPHWS